VNQPDCPKEKYGATTVMIPALEAAVTLNDRRVVDVAGRRYDGRPFSTASPAFSESLRENAG